MGRMAWRGGKQIFLSFFFFLYTEIICKTYRTFNGTNTTQFPKSNPCLAFKPKWKWMKWKQEGESYCESEHLCTLSTQTKYSLSWPGRHSALLADKAPSLGLSQKCMETTRARFSGFKGDYVFSGVELGLYLHMVCSSPWSNLPGHVWLFERD